MKIAQKQSIIIKSNSDSLYQAPFLLFRILLWMPSPFFLYVYCVFFLLLDFPFLIHSQTFVWDSWKVYSFIWMHMHWIHIHMPSQSINQSMRIAVIFPFIHFLFFGEPNVLANEWIQDLQFVKNIKIFILSIFVSIHFELTYKARWHF